MTVLNLASGEERRLQPPELAVSSVFFGPGNALFLVGGPLAGEGGSDIYRVEEDGSVTKVTEEAGQITDPFFAGSGTHLVYGAGRGSFHLLEMATGKVDAFQGSLPVLSANHGSLAYLEAGSEGGVLKGLSLTPGGVTERVLAEFPFEVSMSATRSCTGCPLQSGLALSPEGDFAVIQALPREDWELFLVPLVGSPEEREVRQVTREIQHDLYPTILADGRLLAMKGEGRHRRSHLYDLETGEKIWLFRNNTVRTVAPEYEWAPSPDGTKLLLVAERDGNTVSPERGVYLMDLTRKVTREELLARIRTNLAAERELRARANAMYEPVAGEIRGVVDQISMTRIFDYEEALFQFGSKNVTQPGNRSAIDYIAGKLAGIRFRTGAPVVRCQRGPVGQRGRSDSRDCEPRRGLCRERSFRLQHQEPRGRRQQFGHRGPPGDGSGPGRPPHARHHRDRPLHGRGIGAPGKSGVRPAGRGVRKEAGGSLEQRHGGVRRRPPAGQHHSLLERGYPGRSTWGGHALLGDGHPRRRVLQEHRCGGLLRRVRRHRRGYRLLSHPGQSPLPPVE